jgi:hypothetical protein
MAKPSLQAVKVSSQGNEKHARETEHGKLFVFAAPSAALTGEAIESRRQPRQNDEPESTPTVRDARINAVSTAARATRIPRIRKLARRSGR